MKLIVCLDDRGGMAFHNRRQSKDCVLRDRIIQLVGENTLRMNGYTEKQFTVKPNKTYVSEDFLCSAAEKDYCFAETDDLTPYIADANEVVIFRWNRRYPADLYFPVDLLQSMFKKISESKFAGNSHETITQEVFSR